MLNYAKYKQVKAINHKNKISVEGEKVSKTFTCSQQGSWFGSSWTHWFWWKSFVDREQRPSSLPLVTSLRTPARSGRPGPSGGSISQASGSN